MKTGSVGGDSIDAGYDRLEALYADRYLTDLYPRLDDLEQQELRQRAAAPTESAASTLAYLRRLSPLPGRGEAMLVVGCGAKPETIEFLRSSGFRCLGVEAVASIAEGARRYLADPESVVTGTSEYLPVPDASQDVLLLESVLEHVDSVERTLAEAFRILRSNGIAYVTTTDRLLFHNDEYRRRFFQFYPRVLKESYVFQHLHYDPRLANYTTRPAVHWF